MREFLKTALSSIQRLFELLTIAWLLVLIILFLPITYPFGLYCTYRFKKRLGQHRLISAASILASATPGTLIVDVPRFNSGGTYCWWTPENVCELAPMKILNHEELVEHCKTHQEVPPEFHLYSEWCFEQYLHEEHGRGLLVSASRGREVAKRLLKQRSDLQNIFTMSGPVLFEKWAHEYEAAKAEKNKRGEAGI